MNEGLARNIYSDERKTKAALAASLFLSGELDNLWVDDDV